MQKLSLVILALFIFPLSLVFQAPTAYGCSCIAPELPQASRDQAAAVFAGRVTNIDRPSNFTSTIDPIKVTFDVSYVWKGKESNTINLLTARESASCGFPFEEGKEYLVYANTSEETGDDLHVSLCSRTALLTEANEDMAALGEGQVIVKESQSPAPQGTNNTMLIIGGAIFLIALGALIIAKKHS